MQDNYYCYSYMHACTFESYLQEELRKLQSGLQVDLNNEKARFKVEV